MRKSLGALLLLGCLSADASIPKTRSEDFVPSEQELVLILNRARKQAQLRELKKLELFMSAAQKRYGSQIKRFMEERGQAIKEGDAKKVKLYERLMQREGFFYNEALRSYKRALDRYEKAFD